MAGLGGGSPLPPWPPPCPGSSCPSAAVQIPACTGGTDGSTYGASSSCLPPSVNADHGLDAPLSAAALVAGCKAVDGSLPGPPCVPRTAGPALRLGDVASNSVPFLSDGASCSAPAALACKAQPGSTLLPLEAAGSECMPPARVNAPLGAAAAIASPLLSGGAPCSNPGAPDCWPRLGAALGPPPTAGHGYLQPARDNAPLKTFAQAVLQSVTPSESPLQLHAPASTDSGEPAIFFSMDEIKVSCLPLEYTIVARTPHGRPPFPEIRAHLAQRFKFRQQFLISAIDGRHLFLRFQNKEDFLQVLLKESLYVHGRLFKFFKWNFGFSLEEDSPIAPVWIEFPGLPPNFYNEVMLRSIAGCIGHVLKVDPNTLSMVRTHAARVCVQLDVSKKLPERIWIGFGSAGTWQAIIYPDPPQFCLSCKRLGHMAPKCKNQVGGRTGVDSGAQGIKPVDGMGGMALAQAKAPAPVKAPDPPMCWRPVQPVHAASAPVPPAQSSLVANTAIPCAQQPAIFKGKSIVVLPVAPDTSSPILSQPVLGQADAHCPAMDASKGSLTSGGSSPIVNSDGDPSGTSQSAVAAPPSVVAGAPENSVMSLEPPAVLVDAQSYIQAAAPTDGTTVDAVHPSIGAAPLAGNQTVQEVFLQPACHDALDAALGEEVVSRSGFSAGHAPDAFDPPTEVSLKTDAPPVLGGQHAASSSPYVNQSSMGNMVAGSVLQSAPALPISGQIACHDVGSGLIDAPAVSSVAGHPPIPCSMNAPPVLQYGAHVPPGAIHPSVMAFTPAHGEVHAAAVQPTVIALPSTSGSAEALSAGADPSTACYSGPAHAPCAYISGQTAGIDVVAGRNDAPLVPSVVGHSSIPSSMNAPHVIALPSASGSAETPSAGVDLSSVNPYAVVSVYQSMQAMGIPCNEDLVSIHNQYVGDYGRRRRYNYRRPDRVTTRSVHQSPSRAPPSAEH